MTENSTAAREIAEVSQAGWEEAWAALVAPTGSADRQAALRAFAALSALERRLRREVAQ